MKKNNEINKIFDLYVNGKWDDAEKLLKGFINDSKKDEYDNDFIKEIASHVGVITLIKREKSFYDYFTKSLDVFNKNSDYILNNMFTMNVFKDVVIEDISIDIYEEKILEKMLGYIYGIENNYVARMSMLCRMHLIQEDYYELSDSLRSLAIYLGQEENEFIKNMLKEILKSYIPVCEKNDKYGYYDLEDILKDVCPSLLISKR